MVTLFRVLESCMLPFLKTARNENRRSIYFMTSYLPPPQKQCIDEVHMWTSCDHYDTNGPYGADFQNDMASVEPAVSMLSNKCAEDTVVLKYSSNQYCTLEVQRRAKTDREDTAQGGRQPASVILYSAQNIQTKKESEDAAHD